MALQPNRRWSPSIIWPLVGVAGFGIVWLCFACIDETVQATGKLKP
jgi:multidrug efflux pump subunit AcrA (membrane-fusion protein)